jgi:FkbM family methyltransferase
MKHRLFEKLKRNIKVFTGKTNPMNKEIDCTTKWYGNTYGGTNAHPDILNKNSIVYSFGIGEDISFDKAIIENHGCYVFAFDPTPKSIAWIKDQKLPPNFTFFEYGIASETGYVNFNLPKNSKHVSGSIIGHQNVDKNNSVSVLMKCLSDIIAELGHDHIDVLKIDIEGYEYDVINNILSSSAEIDQILIELHERFFVDGKEKTAKLLKSMKENGYALFAVSDSFKELSYIKMNKVR